MRYSVHLIDEKGAGSYLSVKGRTSWKDLRTARKHADSFRACKNMPFNTVVVEVENEYGELVPERRRPAPEEV